MTNVANVLPFERLADKAKRIRDALSNSDTGPLVIALDVHSLSETWDQYRDEAKGDDLNTWLRRLAKGRDLAWFTRRHEAVVRFGGAIRKAIHHEAAVWAHHNVAATHTSKFKDAVHAGFVANGRTPVSKAQAIAIAREVGGYAPRNKPRGCRHCEELRQRVAELEEQLSAQ